MCNTLLHPPFGVKYYRYVRQYNRCDQWSHVGFIYWVITQRNLRRQIARTYVSLIDIPCGPKLIRDRRYRSLYFFSNQKSPTIHTHIWWLHQPPCERGNRIGFVDLLSFFFLLLPTLYLTRRPTSSWRLCSQTPTPMANTETRCFTILQCYRRWYHYKTIRNIQTVWYLSTVRCDNNNSTVYILTGFRRQGKTTAANTNHPAR